MSNLDPGPLARYNSLQDKHLAGYFSNTKMKKHLIKAGLVKKDGEIVDDNTYRLKMAKKEHQKHVKDLLATAIVHKALDVERMRQYEFRKKLDELYKIELVQRVKGEKKRKGDEEIVPLLLPKGGRRSKSHPGDSFRGSSESSSTGGEGDSPLNDSLPEILYDQHKRRLFTKRAASQDRAERMAEEDRVPYYRSHTQPHPPQKRKQTKRKTPRVTPFLTFRYHCLIVNSSCLFRCHILGGEYSTHCSPGCIPCKTHAGGTPVAPQVCANGEGWPTPEAQRLK